MSDQGWIKLYRKIQSSFVWTNSDQLKLWLLILMKANHSPNKFLFNGQEVSVASGQLVTGAYALASEYNAGVGKGNQLAQRKLWKWVKKFESAEMLAIKSTPKYSVITVKNWGTYQESGNQVAIKGQSKGNQVATNKNEKNDKKKALSSSNVPVAEIIEYLNQKTGKHFTTKAAATKTKINARWKEGHGLDEFKKVIDVKSAEWLGQSEMVQYLRPETLFGTKFEAYLNEQPTGKPAAQQESKSERIKRLQKFVADQHANGSTPDEIQSMVAELGANLSIEKINKIIEMEDES